MYSTSDLCNKWRTEDAWYLKGILTAFFKAADLQTKKFLVFNWLGATLRRLSGYSALAGINEKLPCNSIYLADKRLRPRRLLSFYGGGIVMPLANFRDHI